jgi:trk system potassium uptake protein TrkH
MAATLPWSIYYHDNATAELIGIMACCIACGTTLYRYFRVRLEEFSLRDGFAIVTFSWIIAGIVGALPYWLTGSLPTFVDALFESFSGLTTTGSSVISNVEKLPNSILFWRSLTHWLGGMGIIVMALAIIPWLGVGGMTLYKAEVTSGLTEKLGTRIAETAKKTLMIYLLLTVTQAVLLYAAGMSLFDSMCHTFGTLATGGFSTKNLSIGYYQSSYIEVIVIVFMLLSAMNFGLHYRAVKGKPSVYLNSVEAQVFLFIFIVATVFITWKINGANYDKLSESCLKASFQTASMMTTTGFGTADWEKWPVACQWVLLCLMFMGGCAGSTAGGMKCIRLIIAHKHLVAELSHIIHPRAVTALKVDNKIVDSSMLKSVFAVLSFYVAVWSVSTLALVLMDLDAITALSAATTTLSGVGPGLGKVGAAHDFSWISTPGKLLLIFDMFVGRLEFYPVFVVMTLRFWRD